MAPLHPILALRHTRRAEELFSLAGAAFFSPLETRSLSIKCRQSGVIYVFPRLIAFSRFSLLQPECVNLKM